MTDTPIMEADRPKTGRRRPHGGKGSGRPPPAIVFNGMNIVPERIPKVGAPTVYTEEMAERICNWLEEGRTLRTFCFLEGTPEIVTVNRWRDAHPDFEHRYACARERGMDALAEIAADEACANHAPEDVQRARLALDARKWFASKIAPRKYGDKLDVRQEISGPNGQPIEVRVHLQAQLIAYIQTEEVMNRSDISLEEHEAGRAYLTKLFSLPQLIEATPMASFDSGGGPAGVAALEGDDPSEGVGGD
jgi:hypothetical protein